MSSESESIRCPSSVCRPGSLLLGIVMGDGRVAFSSDRIEIDQEFVDRATASGSPERRFRFSSQCVQSGCKQWTGTRCGVIDKVITQVEITAPTELPECSIRPQCRWFRQSGEAACAVCPLVVTDAEELV